MSATINQIIYNLRNLIKDNRSDDIKISDRQLEFIVMYYRAKLIKQDEDKKRPISSNVIQDLGKVELKKIDASDLNGINTGVIVYKTVNKIPKLIELNNKDAITYVGGLDKFSSIDFVSKARSRWNRHNKYGSKLATAYYRNEYIYINTTNPIKFINIEGIFDNPREVPGFNADTDNYPISSHIISAINDFVLSKELAIFLQTIPDEVNDGSSELKNSNLK